MVCSEFSHGMKVSEVLRQYISSYPEAQQQIGFLSIWAEWAVLVSLMQITALCYLRTLFAVAVNGRKGI
jgi:hypothetical protein